MTSILKEYKMKFRELLNPYGFRSSQKTFYRVINDVLQTLMLRTKGINCSVDFNILPLSLGITDLYCEGYSISILREGRIKNWDWTFEPSLVYHQNEEGVFEPIVFNDGTIENIVEDMTIIVKNKVIPIFERGIDCRTALEELEGFEEAVYGKRLFIPISRSSYLTFLKTGNYKKASQYLHEVIQKKSCNHYERIRVIREKEKRLKIAKAECELITSSDYFKTKADIQSRNDLDKEFRKNLVRSDMFYQNAKNTGHLQRLLDAIPILENDIRQLNNVNSAMAKELKEKEFEHSNKVNKEIEPILEEIKLLSIPDTGYFQKLITDNEVKSLEYLKYPSKRIRRDEPPH